MITTKHVRLIAKTIRNTPMSKGARVTIIREMLKWIEADNPATHRENFIFLASNGKYSEVP